jgi:hypothetical protein
MIGVNGESSFEATLLKRAPNCEVWGYDFSVGGVSAFVSFSFFSVYQLLTFSLWQWGPEIREDPELRNRAYFTALAIGGSDAHGENDNPKVWTLDSLMKLNGTSFRFRASTSPTHLVFHIMTYSLRVSVPCRTIH